MGKLDKYFKDQLEHRSFEWKEEYWVAMNQEIAALQKARRRRRFFWIFFVFLLGLGTLSVLATRRAFVHNNEIATEETSREQHRKAPALIKPLPEPVFPEKEREEIANISEKVISTSRFEVPEISTHVEPLDLRGPENASTQEKTDFLELLSFQVAFERIPEFSFYSEETEPSIASRWKFGAEASACIYPNWNEQTGQWIGGGAGVSVEYALNPRMALGAALRYGVRRSTFAGLDTSTEGSYDFGFSPSSQSLVPTALHVLELPLGVFWSFQPHQRLEAGVGLSYLLAVRGEIRRSIHEYPWERTDQEQADYSKRLVDFYSSSASAFPDYSETETTDSGWLATSELRSLNAQIFLGYEYQMTDEVYAGLRVNYRLLGFYSDGRKGTLEQWPITLDLRARWMFGSKR